MTLGMALILIVEDNELNADMLRRRLTRLGHEVLVAVDGRSGVDLVRERRPDLVVMDMSLPIKDGWQATRELKADAEVASIPVLALTAHAIVGDRAQALAAGCDEYDTKPVDWERLKSKIARLLEDRPAVRGAAQGDGERNR